MWLPDSQQNILLVLLAAAYRLIQTAEHLGRVASISSANSAASSLPTTSSVVAESGNAIISNSSANRPNSAPPIVPSTNSEHARLFRYRPQVAGNVRIRGTSARGRSIKFYCPLPTPLARPHVEPIVCLLGLQQPNTSTNTKPTGCVSAKKAGEEVYKIP